MLVAASALNGDELQANDGRIGTVSDFLCRHGRSVARRACAAVAFRRQVDRLSACAIKLAIDRAKVKASPARVVCQLEIGALDARSRRPILRAILGAKQGAKQCGR